MPPKIFIAKNGRIVLTMILFAIVGFFHYKLKRIPSKEEINSFFPTRPSAYNSRINEIAPDFQLHLLNGEDFSVADAVGKKIVILNFFATWCQPCRDELPEMNGFYYRHKGNLVMVGIASEESEEKIRSFIKEMKVLFPVGIDTEGAVARKYGVDSFPTTVLIGPDGKTLFFEVGAIYNTKVALEPVYRNALSRLNSGISISRENYLKEASLIKSVDPEGKEERSNLTARERKIAERIYCPRGCGKNIMDCNCNLCKTVVEEIRKEIKNNRPDDEIVKTINVRYCREK